MFGWSNQKFILSPATLSLQEMLKPQNKIGLTKMKAYQVRLSGGFQLIGWLLCGSCCRVFHLDCGKNDMHIVWLGTPIAPCCPC